MFVVFNCPLTAPPERFLNPLSLGGFLKEFLQSIPAAVAFGLTLERSSET